MRRRDRYIDYGNRSYGVPADDCLTPPPVQKPTDSKIPEEWRKHAREPWRILFPDLEWTPPRLDD